MRARVGCAFSCQGGGDTSVYHIYHAPFAHLLKRSALAVDHILEHFLSDEAGVRGLTVEVGVKLVANLAIKS